MLKITTNKSSKTKQNQKIIRSLQDVPYILDNQAVAVSWVHRKWLVFSKEDIWSSSISRKLGPQTPRLHEKGGTENKENH